MLIRKPADLKYSEVTPKQVYFNRRQFLGAAAGAAALGGALPAFAAKIAGYQKTAYSVGNEKINALKDISGYNNFYELGTGKEEPSENAKNLKLDTWSLSIEGEVVNKKKFGLDDVLKIAPLEERIYRMRCVEAWSVVVPWVGFPLAALLKQVQPTPKAKFVAFESFYDRAHMLSERQANIPFPYVEGIRLDEAMHPLTILAVGIYGETLPNQNGAPIRLVMPWKYGFKGIKSIVKIRLVGSMPPTTWNMSNSREYGFYSNVNPQVDHPRWTQASERRLGELRRRPTLMFNGYGDQVASLYAGMDLKKNY
jgi:sulfoxide reductase catalytic subunit YedY